MSTYDERINYAYLLQYIPTLIISVCILSWMRTGEWPIGSQIEKKCMRHTLFQTMEANSPFHSASQIEICLFIYCMLSVSLGK